MVRHAVNSTAVVASDPRAPVLALLLGYAARTVESEQSQIAAATIAFVERHADCLQRTCIPGHVTGSAWIISPDRSRALLTRHRKLEKWLQLGGHADGDGDLLAVALREAREESGLTRLRVLSREIFDCDRHLIPARKAEPAHFHYDLRFLLEADPAEPLAISSESKELAWIELGRIAALTPEASISRMVAKTPARA